jgi:hypothetical protein
MKKVSVKFSGSDPLVYMATTIECLEDEYKIVTQDGLSVYIRRHAVDFIEIEGDFDAVADSSETPTSDSNVRPRPPAVLSVKRAPFKQR